MHFLTLLKKLTSFFEPPPFQKPIEDQAEVDKQYRYWRLRIFYSMYFGYAFYYFTRKSFTFAMPSMMADLGFTKAQLGFLGSTLAIAYGSSKFLSGILGDRSNPRAFMALGLILTGLCNFAFGFSSSIIAFACFWGLNGWFQGFGWPPCARLLTHWYSKSERGRWWSGWATAHNIGGGTIPILGAYLAQTYGWRTAMFVPGAICIVVGLWLLNRLRDTPQSLGLPSIEKYKDEHDPGEAVFNCEEEKELSTKQVLFDHVLCNKWIWLLAIAYFFVYFVRTGVNDWTVLFLVETKGYSQVLAGTTVFWFEVGGFAGMLFAGWVSDQVFNGRRGQTLVLYSAGIIGATWLFWASPSGVWAVDSLLMFLIGFAVFGPQMLVGLTAAEFAHKKAAATATGFTGCFAYMGAAAAGYPLGKITHEFGWEGYFMTLVGSAFLTTLLFSPLWSTAPQPKPVKVG